MTGYLVENLGPSQLSFTLINRLNFSGDGVFYSENVRPCLDINFFSSSLEDCIHCEKLISTNLELTYYAKKKGRPLSFLLWDLEWMRNNDYGYTSQIYNDEDIEILVRSKSHKKAFEKAWNRKAKIFNLEKSCQQN